MDNLTYLDVSSNKMRNVDRTLLGDLPYYKFLYVIII